MRYSPDSRFLVLGFAERTLKFLDLRTNQVVFKSDDLHPGMSFLFDHTLSNEHQEVYLLLNTVLVAITLRPVAMMEASELLNLVLTRSANFLGVFIQVRASQADFGSIINRCDQSRALFKEWEVHRFRLQ